MGTSTVKVEGATSGGVEDPPRWDTTARVYAAEPLSSGRSTAMLNVAVVEAE